MITKKNEPRDGQHPQISAKAEASEALTFRVTVSSKGGVRRSVDIEA